VVAVQAALIGSSVSWRTWGDLDYWDPGAAADAAPRRAAPTPTGVAGSHARRASAMDRRGGAHGRGRAPDRYYPKAVGEKHPA
jgi:hypothetical protein